MGLTSQSSGLNLLRESFNLDSTKNNPIVALAGNPNTGKSTLFNGLTGLKQHTGNWPGKTVTQARGYYNYLSQEYTVVDLPGTYSLLADSQEEQLARDFICFAKPDVTIVIADATNLERNLNLVLQVTELTDQVVLCLNLMDQARKKGIEIDISGLANDLQTPIIPTVAREGKGLEDLKKVVSEIANNKFKINPFTINYSSEIETAIIEIVAKLKEELGQFAEQINFRWLALRLFEGDESIIESVQQFYRINEKKLRNSEVKVDGSG